MEELHVAQPARGTTRLWNVITNPWFLAIATILVLSVFLGAKELWTQEWRWANITRQMVLRHDYLHPYLGQFPYYDKPLLSYWMMIAFSFVTGGLNIWALRLPSVLAGVITVLSTYSLGKRLSNKATGALAGWILISTAAFVFWSRIANTDMLNVAGIMLALAWYFARREKPGFWSYFIFFLILAVTSLCKGLVAPAVVFIALIPDLLYENHWQTHLRMSFLVALVINIAIYLSPFLASLYFNPNHYTANGLRLVFQENILRYFQPFDHKGSVSTYFWDLPAYILPWIIFYIPAIWSCIRTWRKRTVGSHWLAWANLLIFIFFTASGSRRSYYILPMLPLVALFIADWLYNYLPNVTKWKTAAAYTAIGFYTIMLLLVGLIYPVAYSGGGLTLFAKAVRTQAEKIKPWKEWQLAALDTKSKTMFYLNSPNLVEFLDAKGETKEKPTRETLKESFPILFNNPEKRILIISTGYEPFIKDIEAQYTVIKEVPVLSERWFNPTDPSRPVALIPKTESTTAK